MRFLFIIPLGLALAVFGGCGEDKHEHDGHDHAEHSHEGHDHGEKGHDGHDHGEEGHDDAHGEKHALGSLNAGEIEFSVDQFGDVSGASEGVFTLTAAAGNVGEVRIWIGTADGRGSVKTLLEYDTEHKQYHGHAEIPATLADNAAVWVSVTKDGNTSNGSIAFHK